jgi:hypothetical protein
MGVTDWFRKLFSPGSSTGSAEDDAIEQEEYGGPDLEAPPEPGGAIAGGVSGYAGLEDAAAVEGVEKEFEAPSDPAP